MSDNKRFPVKKNTMAQTNAIMIHSSDVKTTFVKGVDLQKSKACEEFMRPISFEGEVQVPNPLVNVADHLKKHEPA